MKAESRWKGMGRKNMGPPNRARWTEWERRSSFSLLAISRQRTSTMGFSAVSLRPTGLDTRSILKQEWEATVPRARSRLSRRWALRSPVLSVVRAVGVPLGTRQEADDEHRPGLPRRAPSADAGCAFSGRGFDRGVRI